MTVVSDPGLQPTKPGKLAGDLNSLLGLLGPIDPALAARSKKGMQSDALAYVEAQTKPLIDYATTAATRRGEGGANAIAGLSGALIDDVRQVPGEIRANYDVAKNAELGGADALRSILTAGGGSLQQELAAKIAAAGGPQESLDEANRMTTGAAAGFGGEVAARGYTGYSALNGMGAADVASAERLPGVYAAGADRSNRLLQAGLNAGLQDEVGRINASAPGLAAQILQALRGEEVTKAGMRADHRGNRASIAGGLLEQSNTLEFQKAAARQGYQLDTTKLSQDESQFGRNLGAQVDYWNKQDQNADLDRAAGVTGNAAAVKEKHDTYLRYALGDAQTFVSSLIETKPVPIPGKPGFYKGANGRPTRDAKKALTAKSAPTYAEAFKRARSLVAQYAPLGLTGPEINQIVKNALASVGIVPPQATPDSGGGTRTGPHGTGR